MKNKEPLRSAYNWFALFLLNLVLSTLFVVLFPALMRFFGNLFGFPTSLPDSPIVDVLFGVITFLSLLIIEVSIYLRIKTEKLPNQIAESIKDEFSSSIFESLLTTEGTDSETRSNLQKLLQVQVNAINDIPPKIKPLSTYLLKNRSKDIVYNLTNINSQPIDITTKEAMKINNILLNKYNQYRMVSRELVNPEEHWTEQWQKFAEEVIKPRKDINAKFTLYKERTNSEGKSLFETLETYLLSNNFQYCSYIEPKTVKNAHSKFDKEFDYLEIYGGEVLKIIDKIGDSDIRGFVDADGFVVRFLDIGEDRSWSAFYECLSDLEKDWKTDEGV